MKFMFWKGSISVKTLYAKIHLFIKGGWFSRRFYMKWSLMDVSPLSGDCRKSALKLLMDFVSWKHGSLHYTIPHHNTLSWSFSQHLNITLFINIEPKYLNCLRFPIKIYCFGFIRSLLNQNDKHHCRKYNCRPT